MNSNKKFNIALVVIILIAMILIGNYYFKIFTEAIQTYSERDAKMLQTYNYEIIDKLQKCDSIDEWQSIIDSYKEIIIHVEDSNGNHIAKTSDKEWSLIDVKIQNAFKYGEDAYLIRSSVYFIRNYLTDSGYLYRIIITVLLSAISIFIIICIAIYAIMLRPVYQIYDNIERYENGEKLKKTRRKSEIAKLQNRFIEMTENISTQQQNQKRIIASISHDIKTPLTSIMGYAELLKKDLPEERKERYLNTVYQKALDIKDLIDDFDEYLSFDMDSGVKTEKMTFDTMMLKLTDLYEEELERFGVKFIYHHQENNDVVGVDIQKMKRVIGNIIGNSLKHFGDNEKIIEVTTQREETYEKIIISDSGTGVDDEKLNIIFEPLYTSDEGRKVAGLGLAICREIVEGHGGSIWAEKSKYGGLAVVIRLNKIV